MKQHIPHRRAIRIAVILTVCLAVFAVTGYAWMQTQLVSSGNTISPASVSLSVSDSQLQFKVGSPVRKTKPSPSPSRTAAAHRFCAACSCPGRLAQPSF